MRRSLRIDWRWFLTFLLLVVLFVPPRRYTLPLTLPFELDPYRLVIMCLGGLLLLSLLADDSFRIRPSGLEGPVGLYMLAVFGSYASNPGRVVEYHVEVVKVFGVIFGAVLTYYLTVNFVRSRAAAETVLSTLVLGAAALAVLGIIEARSGWSPFVGMDRYVPFLRPTEVDLTGFRDGRLRVLSSSEHPIAFGALLALLVPIAAALAVRRRTPIWWVSLLALVAGAVSTLSRTPILMILASSVVFGVMRPREVVRFLPAVLVVFAAVHFVMPGALGTLRGTFNIERLISEQEAMPDSAYAGGRLTDVSPSFKEFKYKPLFGYGVGTRIVSGPKANARILDDQWLASLLDVGMVGVAALAWFILRYVRSLLWAAKRVGDDDAVLLVGLASASVAFAVGMFTYDALGFTQTALIFYVLMGVGSALVLARDPIIAPIQTLEPSTAEATRPRERRRRLDPVA